jgi:hypothetical protein
MSASVTPRNSAPNPGRRGMMSIGVASVEFVLASLFRNDRSGKEAFRVSLEAARVAPGGAAH